MAISNTTKITCDYVDAKGKPCKKVFLVPDPPDKPTPGYEDVFRLVPVEGGDRAKSFCSMLHLVAFGVAWLKATPKEEPKPKEPKIVKPTAEQISSLAAENFILKDDA